RDVQAGCPICTVTDVTYVTREVNRPSSRGPRRRRPPRYPLPRRTMSRRTRSIATLLATASLVVVGLSPAASAQSLLGPTGSTGSVGALGLESAPLPAVGGSTGVLTLPVPAVGRTTAETG